MTTHGRRAALTLLVKALAALVLTVVAYVLFTITAFACDVPEEAICVRSQSAATGTFFLFAFVTPWVLCCLDVGSLAARQDERTARRTWRIATAAWSVLICADILYLPILAR